MEKEDNKMRPLTLVIDKELWYEFKMGTSREKSLNTTIVDLIRKEVEKRKR